MTKSTLSLSFLDDALFYIFTILPLVFFFGLSPIIILASIHILSGPCGVIAYVDRMGKEQVFFITAIVFLSLVADCVILLFGYCQFPFPGSSVSCDIARISGFKSKDEIALGFFLLPIAAYNSIFSVSRLSQIASNAKASSPFGIAIVTCVRVLHITLIFAQEHVDRSTIAYKLLVISVVYSAFSSLIAACNWNTHSDEALTASFVADCVTIALQTYATFVDLKLSTSTDLLGITSSMVLLTLAISSFAITTILLLFCTERDMPVNTWTRIALLAHLAFVSFFFLRRWQKWNAFEATIFVSYFTTTPARAFAFIATDSLIAVIFESVLFLLIDVAAFTYVAFVLIDQSFPPLLFAFEVIIFVQGAISIFVANEQMQLIATGKETFAVDYLPSVASSYQWAKKSVYRKRSGIE
jgi:hypothetical protein